MRVDVCPHIDAQGAFDTTRPRSTVTGRRFAPRDARHARDARRGVVIALAVRHGARATRDVPDR